MNVSGKMMMNEAFCTTSGDFTDNPTRAISQEIA